MRTVILTVLRIWSLLPLRFLQMLGAMIGSIHHWTNSRAAQVTEVNLELCGLNKDLRRQSLQETGKTMMETPAVWLGARGRIDAWLGEVHKESLLREAVLADQGLLILLPHLGNWEMFNVFFRRYGKMTALYQPPRSPALNEIMRNVREGHGNEMVPTDRRGIRRLYRVLKGGGTVVILPDQVPVTGRFIPFFGTAALTDELAVRLLKKTGAKMLMLAFLRRFDGKFDVYVSEADEILYQGDPVSAMTALNSMVESAIALGPTQYQWEYKRFRERPVGEKKVYRFNKPARVHD